MDPSPPKIYNDIPTYTKYQAVAGPPGPAPVPVWPLTPGPGRLVVVPRLKWWFPVWSGGSPSKRQCCNFTLLKLYIKPIRFKLWRSLRSYNETFKHRNYLDGELPLFCWHIKTNNFNVFFCYCFCGRTGAGRPKKKSPHFASKSLGLRNNRKARMQSKYMYIGTQMSFNTSTGYPQTLGGASQANTHQKLVPAMHEQTPQ